MSEVKMTFLLEEDQIKEAIKRYVEGISGATITKVNLTVSERRDATDRFSMGHTLTAEAS